MHQLLIDGNLYLAPIGDNPQVNPQPAAALLRGHPPAIFTHAYP